MRIIAAAIALSIVGPPEGGHYQSVGGGFQSVGSGRLQPALTQISKSGKGAFEASFTPLGNQLVAAWYDTRDGNAEIYIRVLDGSGRPAGPERRITHGSATDFSYEPDVSTLGGDIVIAWYDVNGDRYRAQLARVTRDGRVRWQHTLTNDGKNPVVRTVKDEIVVAWLERDTSQLPTVRAQFFDGDGKELGPSQFVAPAGKTTWNLNAAVDGSGQMWVVFDATAGTKADELFAARVGKTTSTVTRLTADDGKPSKYPDLAFQGSRAALSWQDERDGNVEVYLLVGDTPALVEGMEARATRLTDTPGESIGAYLAWNGDRVGLAWCDNSINRQHEVYLAQFDFRGTNVGGTLRLTNNTSNSLIPAIHPWRDGFALVWNEFVQGRDGGHGTDGKSEVWFAFMPKARPQ